MIDEFNRNLPPLVDVNKYRDGCSTIHDGFNKIIEELVKVIYMSNWQQKAIMMLKNDIEDLKKDNVDMEKDISALKKDNEDLKTKYLNAMKETIENNH